MAEVSTGVKIITHTPNPKDRIIEAAAVCWDKTPRDGMLKHLVKVGHMSPFKFAHFTFEIDGVSRVFSHQRVRKQVGDDKLQQSQRHVIYDDGFEYIIPPTIKDNTDEYHKFIARMDIIHGWYIETMQAGIPAEDARFYLPGACGTKLRTVSSMLSLIEESMERLCTCAQWEYRGEMIQIKNAMMELDPELGELLQPKCKWVGYCKEDRNVRWCKRAPHITDLNLQIIGRD